MSMKTLYTYSGKISFPDAAPSLMDIAISLSREGRYAGAGLRVFTVALHCFVVADLLPPRLKFHGLMHDASECITGDIPSPVKTEEIRAFERMLLVGIYKSFGVQMPSDEEHALIKAADDKALQGEVWVGAGTQSLQELNPRCLKAEASVLKYINLYSYADLFDAGGRAPIEFIRRFRMYRDLLPVVK